MVLVAINLHTRTLFKLIIKQPLKILAYFIFFSILRVTPGSLKISSPAFPQEVGGGFVVCPFTSTRSIFCFFVDCLRSSRPRGCALWRAGGTREFPGAGASEVGGWLL